MRTQYTMDAVRLFHLLTILLFGLIWLGAILLFRFKQRKGFVYLLLFTIFFVYIFKVIDYTLLQFQSLIILKYFVPSLMLKGQTAGDNLNLIPLITLTASDVKTSLLNILLFMPFGFGLPFVTNFAGNKVVLAGALFSVAIEFLQFSTGLLAHITFRVADINDVIFNTLGVFIGYLLFVGVMQTYEYVLRQLK